MNSSLSFERFVLISAAVGLSIVGLTYGAAPFGFSGDLYHVTVDNPNDAMILRGIMGLLLGTSVYYYLGYRYEQHRRGALMTLMLFLGGLVFGRIISFIFDGGPYWLYYFYAVVEALYAALAYRALKLRGDL